MVLGEVKRGISQNRSLTDGGIYFQLTDERDRCIVPVPAYLDDYGALGGLTRYKEWA